MAHNWGLMLPEELNWSPGRLATPGLGSLPSTRSPRFSRAWGRLMPEVNNHGARGGNWALARYCLGQTIKTTRTPTLPRHLYLGPLTRRTETSAAED